MERLKMISSITLYLILISLVLYARRKGTLISRLGFKEKINYLEETLTALGYIIILLCISIAIGMIFYSLGMHQDLAKSTEIIKQLPLHEVIIVLLIGSFVEEIFFRGYIQEKTNILIASFIFGFFHIVYGSISQIVGTFFLGLALGYEYKKTGGVYSPIITHTAYNLIVITFMVIV